MTLMMEPPRQSPDRTAAVANRRTNRAARKSIEREKREKREALERQVAHRMTERFYRGQMPSLMVLDYRYWQARRCGWDMLSKELAIDPLGRPCDPHVGETWCFWKRQHYKHRAQLVTLSIFRLYRR
jgi:hypothetical protein